MSEYYLEDNPPASSQYSDRLVEEVGLGYVHTAEGVMDNIGLDTGAENTAHFISTRTNPGCYGEIGDSDSIVKMIPYNKAAFHIVSRDAYDVNLRHCSRSFSFATAAHLWGTDPAWDASALALMGETMAEYFLDLASRRAGYEAEMSLRWLTQTEAGLRQPGLCLHGTSQPSDRTDAWVNNPLRPQLEATLIEEISKHILTPSPVPPPKPPSVDRRLLILEP